MWIIQKPVRLLFIYATAKKINETGAIRSSSLERYLDSKV